MVKYKVFRDANAGDPLTAREVEVTRAILAGHTNSSAALLFGLSERTIEHHRLMARKKFGAQSAYQFILGAQRYGLSPLRSIEPASPLGSILDDDDALTG